jgi:hypothetical protein
MGDDVAISFDNGSVSVDNDFARFGAKSYAINKINTVEVRERQPHGIGSAIICAIIAILCLMAAIGKITDGKSDEVLSTFLFAAIFGGIAYWCWVRSKILEYQLYLMTTSSEAQAYTSRDAETVSELRTQIERAMTR